MRTPLVRPEDEVVRYCPNVTCPGRVLEGIVHFASRDAMDIRGLGYERVKQLIDAKLVTDVASLYALKGEQLLQLDRFAEQSAKQLIAAIEASRTRPLATLLFGIGIRHVGKNVAQLLARHFGTFDKLAAATAEQIEGVPGVGHVIAEAVAEFCREPKSVAMIDRLRAAGVNLTEPNVVQTEGPLTGKTYVVTGTLPTLSRKEATQLIEKAGGRIGGSVTKSTSVLVAGGGGGLQARQGEGAGC